MPINKNVLKQEIERATLILKRIENMDFSESELLENPDYQDMLAFRIQQLVEICIDIATHIIANQPVQSAENARSSFEVLAKNNIITPELATNLAKAVGMRNLIVHQYDDIDYYKVYEIYKTDMKDIKESSNRLYRTK
jgi:uncharacterized protein YutE (UPF0331/DUF86 family)